MALQEKQLGQSNPGVTTVVSLYSPPANTTAIVKTIYVCNSSSTVTAKFRIFFDDDGNTYSAATCLFYDVPINPNTTLEIDTFIAMNNQLGNIGVRTDTISILTFTAFGAEEA